MRGRFVGSFRPATRAAATDVGADVDFLPQVTGTAHFSKDLGLDSLDTVEVVMAIEEACGHRHWRSEERREG